MNKRKRINPQVLTLYASLFVVLANLFALASLIVAFRNPNNDTSAILGTELI